MTKEIRENKVSQSNLKQKVAKIATNATVAVNALSFGSATDPIDGNIIIERVHQKCFPPSAAAENHNLNDSASRS